MEDQILNLFAHNESLIFSQIHKLLKIRSNKLAYYLNKLIKTKKLERDSGRYRLSKESEYLIPYLSSKKAVITVVLVYIGNKKEAFLAKRAKRPFKGMLGLPGGRLLVGESIKEAAHRIMREKHNININNLSTYKIALEQVKKKKEIVHSFLLIVVKAENKEVSKINIGKNKNQIIKSDYILITKNFSKVFVELATKV